MQRMTGIDPMFIYSDTPDTPMEVAYACVFDPSTAEEGYSFERVCDVLNERLPNLAPFRRRLITVPLGLDHPRWVDDPTSTWATTSSALPCRHRAAWRSSPTWWPR